ncbi:MAG: glycosyltransferase [Rubellimicrobium sp.]|nr:glycosyltransferase [Rubellimicrobium sp.]
MHVVVTANTSWSVWNFRRSLIAALMREGHGVTVLAPPDDSVARLRAMGCRFEPLVMDAKGLNPLKEWALLRRFRRAFATLRPDVVLSYTIKNNVFGAMAAQRLGIPIIPVVTGLGTAFLSRGLLQFAAERLSHHAFNKLPCVFFLNHDDSDLFLTRLSTAE